MENRRTDLAIRTLAAQDWPIIRDVLKISWTDDTAGLVAESKGERMGAVVYQNIAEDCCTMHHILAEPYILAQGWGEAVFGLPFKHYKMNKVWGTLPAWNKKAISFCEQIGFKHVTVIPEYWGNVDCFIMRLDKADCKYLGD